MSEEEALELRALREEGASLRELKSAFIELQQAFVALKEAYSQLQVESQQKDERINELERALFVERMHSDELERRLTKDSHNSSKPPSSDGLRCKGKVRKKSPRKSGGQPGHVGHTLAQIEQPDYVEEHRPERCEDCGEDLAGQVGHVKERRQVHDLPPLRLEITEHQALCI